MEECIFIESDHTINLLGFFTGLGKETQGIGFFPFLVIRNTLRLPHKREELIIHERIHIRQQLELLIIGAHLLFICEYIYARYILALSKRDAYYYPATEQEAHRNAMNPHYLKERMVYSIFKYIRDKKKLSRDDHDNLVIENY